jgi:hypothetical protein
MEVKTHVTLDVLTAIDSKPSTKKCSDSTGRFYGDAIFYLVLLPATLSDFTAIVPFGMAR